MSRTGELGAAGEELAVAWLRAHGFIIMDRNWRMGRYELDIVAARGDRVHFVEVKLRRERIAISGVGYAGFVADSIGDIQHRDGGLTRPEEAMTPAKGRALLRAANCYIETCGVMLDCQIDLIAVEYAPDGSTEVRYVPDAVTLRW